MRPHLVVALSSLLLLVACGEDPPAEAEGSQAPLTYADPQPVDVPAAEAEEEEPEVEAVEPEEVAEEDTEEPAEEATEAPARTAAAPRLAEDPVVVDAVRRAAANGQLNGVRNLPRIQLPINRQPGTQLPLVNRQAPAAAAEQPR